MYNILVTVQHALCIVKFIHEYSGLAGCFRASFKSLTNVILYVSIGSEQYTEVRKEMTTTSLCKKITNKLEEKVL